MSQKGGHSQSAKTVKACPFAGYRPHFDCTFSERCFFAFVSQFQAFFSSEGYSFNCVSLRLMGQVLGPRPQSPCHAMGLLQRISPMAFLVLPAMGNASVLPIPAIFYTVIHIPVLPVPSSSAHYGLQYPKCPERILSASDSQDSKRIFSYLFYSI